MFNTRITYATNIKPVFYRSRVFHGDILKARGWTFRWLKLHIRYERRMS
jgi:hypothetical protein